MVRVLRMFVPALAALALVLLGTGAAKAQAFYAGAPVVSYYAPPVGGYYSPPVVYSPPATVSYYYAPAISYYTPAYYPPAVSYYAAPSSTLTTTRYGLFGRPRYSATRYYSPVYMWP